MRNLFLLVLSCFTLTVSAQTSDTVRRLFVTLTTTANTTVSRMLPTFNGTDRGPVLDFTKQSVVFTNPHRSISLKRADHFSFHIETVTGIEDITVPATAAVEGNVYNLSGQLVREHATDLEGLPKGVYIVNGKKHIVR